MKFGVQLYGPLNCMQGADEENRALEHLRALAASGVTEIEPCVNIGCAAPEAVIWPIGWLMEHGEEIQGMGLAIRSIHLIGSNLAGNMEELSTLAKKLGLRQYVVKTPMDCPLQQAALTYMKAADRLAEVGVDLLLHNEAEDIQTKTAGKTAYERLLDLCMGKVGAQVDVGWVAFAGEDPVRFLERNAWRVKSLHHKDFILGGEPVDVPAGAGDVDLAACFGFAQARDIPQIIDQEHFGPDVPGELAAARGKLNGFPYESRKNTVSYLNIYDIETGEVKTLSRFGRVIEAPNWLRSGVILYNSEGRIYAYNAADGQEMLVDTGLCDQCNNDHVVSPDERFIAVSHNDAEEGYSSRAYIVPLDVGFSPARDTGDGTEFQARLVTPDSPSYLHGWSPDGKELAYCAFREVNGKLEVDVYTIPAEGGEEKRLTGGGFNDGCEYSPDGRHIWYNSTRSGLMQIWRMDRDGGNQAQITKNERNNWFGHISPDSKKVVYISYGKDQLEPYEHLPNMPVELWMMDADGGNQHKLLSLFGGQGSINVNSWAADSRRFAFISYEKE